MVDSEYGLKNNSHEIRKWFVSQTPLSMVVMHGKNERRERGELVAHGRT